MKFKKIVVLGLIATLTVSAFMITGCNDKKKEPVKIEEDVTKETTKSSLDVLKKIWSSYEDEQKFFAMGGNQEKVVQNEPGKFDITKTDELKSMLVISEDVASKLDNAANLIHGMNSNTFTCGAYQFKDTKDLVPAIKVIREGILNKKWMCGFPEVLAISKVDDETIVVNYGNKDMVKYFMDKLQKEYKGNEFIQIIDMETKEFVK